MIEILVAGILISAILMAGFRRIKLLNWGFIVQSLAIALLCFAAGYLKHSYHYYILGGLIFIAKVIIIPYIINKASKNLKVNREMKPIISGYWSYIFVGIATAATCVLLKNYNSYFLKTGVVVMVTGAMLLIGRKKATTQMIGFLSMENGLVLIEISMVKMAFMVEIGIILEVLLLSLIMGIMIILINKTFGSVNTDYLSNLKE